MKILHDWVIIDPCYDAEKIGSIIIPRSYENPEAQQGIVVSKGPQAQVLVGEYVIFHPFSSIPYPTKDGYICVRSRDIVCTKFDNQLQAKEGDAKIRPDWASKYAQKGLVYLPPTAREDYSAVLFGEVLQVCAYVGIWFESGVRVGDRIVIPPGIGAEAALDTELFYFVPLKEILAVIH